VEKALGENVLGFVGSRGIWLVRVTGSDLKEMGIQVNRLDVGKSQLTAGALRDVCYTLYLKISRKSVI